MNMEIYFSLYLLSKLTYAAIAANGSHLNSSQSVKFLLNVHSLDSGANTVRNYNILNYRVKLQNNLKKNVSAYTKVIGRKFLEINLKPSIISVCHLHKLPTHNFIFARRESSEK